MRLCNAPVEPFALALDLARGVSKNDRAFHERNEKYGFESNRDCSLFTGSRVGIIGFGDLARAFRPMLRPFRCPVKVFDPWLPERELLHNDCTPASLDDLLSTSDAVFVFASVTSENQGFLGAFSHPAGRAFCAHEPGRSRRLRSVNGLGQVGPSQSGDGCLSRRALLEAASDSGPSQCDSLRPSLGRNPRSLYGDRKHGIERHGVAVAWLAALELQGCATRNRKPVSKQSSNCVMKPQELPYGC